MAGTCRQVSHSNTSSTQPAKVWVKESDTMAPAHERVGAYGGGTCPAVSAELQKNGLWPYLCIVMMGAITAAISRVRAQCAGRPQRSTFAGWKGLVRTVEQPSPCLTSCLEHHGWYGKPPHTLFSWTPEQRCSCTCARVGPPQYHALLSVALHHMDIHSPPLFNLTPEQFCVHMHFVCRRICRHICCFLV